MYIRGIGIVFNRGRGIDILERALKEGRVPPDLNSMAYHVPDNVLLKKAGKTKMRRADRFSRMSITAALDAVSDSNIDLNKPGSSPGLILATTFGPHDTTFRYLDGILDYGHANVSPTVFSHSIHNAALSYISIALNCHSNILTVTHFIFSFHQALMLAESWIKQNQCKNVLVGCVDVCGNVMEDIAGHKLNISSQGKIKPFECSEKPSALPGEGSVFFMLSGDKGDKSYCKISSEVTDRLNIIEKKPDICILDADGMAGDESGYNLPVFRQTKTAGYSPIFGSMMINPGFSAAAGSLMIKNQISYPSPVSDNPHNMKISSQTHLSEIYRILCLRVLSNGQTGVVSLTFN